MCSANREISMTSTTISRPTTDNKLLLNPFQASLNVCIELLNLVARSSESGTNGTLSRAGENAPQALSVSLCRSGIIMESNRIIETERAVISLFLHTIRIITTEITSLSRSLQVNSLIILRMVEGILRMASIKERENLNSWVISHARKTRSRATRISIIM